MHSTPLHTRHSIRHWAVVAILGMAWGTSVHGSDTKEEPATQAAPKADIEASSASNPKDIGAQVREALGRGTSPNKKLIVSVERGKDTLAVAPRTRRTLDARAAALLSTPAPMATEAKPAGTQRPQAHWAYEGENGPQAWGRLKPEFNLCSAGRRQSPIGIDDSSTLQGPAEPIQFNYGPSNGTVVNNGYTIQVDVQGDNALRVRGSSYRLLQFHFHSPSEEQINTTRFPMVAHLVHRNAEGQLAIVAVLLDVGAASPLIDAVWTYLPLDAGDQVRMPHAMLNLAELLPTDQRYYQFMGSLTEPPCSEGVLWMVLKAPVTISKAQLKLFTQLYPNNARPIQPLNARPVRNAQ